MTLKEQLFENRSLKQIFLKNTFWLTVAEGLSKFFKFFLIPLSARMLGPEKFGILGYTISLLATVYIFSDFGLASIFIREFKKQETTKDRLFSSLLIIKSVLLVLSTLAAVACYFWIDDPQVRTIFFIILGTTAFDQAKKLWSTISEANSKMHYRGVGLVSESAITTLFGLYVLATHPSIIGIAWAYFWGNSISFFIMLFLVRREIPIPLILDKPLIRRILKLCIPFLLIIGISFLLISTDTLLIKWLLGATEVGYYQAAAKFIQFGLIVPYLVNIALYPIMSSLHNQHKRLAEVLKQSIGALLMVAIPALIGGLILGKPIVLKIFGHAYTPSIIIFKILLFSLFIEFLLTLINNTLLVLNQEKANLKISTAALVMNILLNLILIPFIGIKGSALATVFAKTFDITATYWLCAKTLKGYRIFPAHTIIHVLAAGLMAIQLIILNNLHVPVILNASIAIGTYSLGLVFFKEPQVWRAITILRNK